MMIRPASITDKEAITRLHCDSWEATFMTFNPELVKARGNQYPRRLQQWDERLRDKHLFTCVAINNEGIITGLGQGGAVLEDRELPQYDAELTLLYVAPEHQGKGIGKRLINEVARTMQKQGKQSLVIVAWSINEPAKAIYQHLGAVFVKESVQEKEGFNTSQTVFAWKNIQTVIDATS